MNEDSSQAVLFSFMFYLQKVQNFASSRHRIISTVIASLIVTGEI